MTTMQLALQYNMAHRIGYDTTAMAKLLEIDIPHGPWVSGLETSP